MSQQTPTIPRYKRYKHIYITHTGMYTYWQCCI